MLTNLTPVQIRDAMASRSDLVLIDVREPGEFAIACLPDARLIPLRTLPDALDTLPRDQEIVLLCHHGVRSAMAGEYLLSQGFARVSHMVGGIARWSEDVDPTVPTY